ncbi:LOW QUALITY PROTEIN: UPF0575 protein C19orf67 homolog [Discoglossus pictus]
MESCDLPCSTTEEQSEEQKLRPLLDTLRYLQRKGEALQSYLLYSRDSIRREQFSLALPVLLRVSQPFLLYLESIARDTCHRTRSLPETLQRRLLDLSQQLVGRLEQLSLMYGSFGFISLDDTDPGGMACVLCGRFALGSTCVVSIFRYFMPAPYSHGHRALYKKLRWNVEVSEENAHGKETSTKYLRPLSSLIPILIIYLSFPLSLLVFISSLSPFVLYSHLTWSCIHTFSSYFLCYRDTGLDVSCPMDVSRGVPLPSPGPPDMHKLWSIGLWVPLEPACDTDLMSWVLCAQPSGWYHQILTVGFYEPSHTAATDFLVQILTNPGEGSMSQQANPTCLSQMSPNCLAGIGDVP